MGLKMKVPVKVIARYVKCTPKTIRNWRERLRETGDMKRKQGSGRKKTLTAREESLIHRETLKNRRLSSMELVREITSPNGKLRVHPCTVRRILQCRGLYARVAKRNHC